MKESTSLPSLPPLSIKALTELEAIEDQFAEAVEDCNDLAAAFSESIFNASSQRPRRIERSLRTYLPAALDVQIRDYSSLPNYEAAWIVAIIANTVNDLVGFFPPFADRSKYRRMLLEAATEYVKSKQWNLPKGKTELLGNDSATNQTITTIASVDSQEDELRRRWKLLQDYKAATNNTSNKRIYEAKNSGIHKPQFYEWLHAKLPSESSTTVNFERFLREKKPALSRRTDK
jgi:hypothetical protein